MFIRLVISDFKRIRHLIIPFIIILAALLSVMTAILLTSDKLVRKDTPSPVNVGIAMKADSDYAMTAYRFIKDMESYKSICNFVEVPSKDAGIKLLEQKEIDTFIYVPDNILSDIMNGTNTPVEIIYPENGSLQTLVLNELFTSTASFLGTSQAAIYTVLSLSRELEIPDETYAQISEDINALFFNHVLSRYNLFETKELAATGKYSIPEYYAAAILLILLFLCSILFLPFLKSYNRAVKNQLKANGINTLRICISHFTAICSILYLFYIILYCASGMISGTVNLFTITINPMGFAIGLVISAVISFIAILTSLAPVSLSGCSLLLFMVILLIAYSGGLLIPELLLPDLFKNICPYTPGNILLNLLCRCIYT